MRKKSRAWAGVALLAAATAWGAGKPADSATQPQNLEQVLTEMDRAAPAFQSVEADISVDNYTAVVQDHSLQKGTTAFRRVNGSMQMVTHLKDASGQPAADLLYENGTLEYYNPTAKQETIFSAGANRGEWDSMLATGFGARGNELRQAWNVTFKGMDETVKTAAGAPTAELVLVSKDPKVQSSFSQVTIWVDLARDISMKQVMLQPDGDSRTATYSNIRYNKPLRDDVFKLNVAPGTQVQRR
jgi:outer membrane lipoprotein-sorting protein